MLEPRSIISFIGIHISSQLISLVANKGTSPTICLIKKGTVKWPVYVFIFGEINSRQVNVGGIQIFLAQFQDLKLHKKMLNAANIYLFGIIPTKGKYIDRSCLLNTCLDTLPTKTIVLSYTSISLSLLNIICCLEQG